MAGEANPAATGALVIRVWREGAKPDEHLRARFLGSVDITKERPEPPEYAEGLDNIVAKMRDWLEYFTDDP